MDPHSAEHHLVQTRQVVVKETVLRYEPLGSRNRFEVVDVSTEDCEEEPPVGEAHVCAVQMVLILRDELPLIVGVDHLCSTIEWETVSRWVQIARETSQADDLTTLLF